MDDEMQRRRARVAALLERLQEVGSNLSLPHEIEFFFFAIPNEQLANALADTLRKESFACSVSRDDDDDVWACIATKSMVPDYETMVSLESRFTEMGHTFSCDYDGWGTSAVS